MKSDKKIVNSLENNIRQRVDMDELVSDSLQPEISIRVKRILRALFSDDWQPEAYHRHQNFSERRHQTIIRQTNNLLDRNSVPLFA